MRVNRPRAEAEDLIERRSMNGHDDYRCAITLDAPIASVYDALSTPAGLRGWWGTDAQVATEVGGHTRFNWSPTSFIVFRVEQLVRPTTIEWSCVEQQDENLPHPDEWVGTTLSFDLTDDAGATRLAFVHRGLIRDLDCFETCESGWDHFLRHSLRRLVETGRGIPYEPATPRAG
jgi:uncharacterized protein YndB with AHSA1/START domain